MKIVQILILSASSLLFVGCDLGDKMVNEYEKNKASVPIHTVEEKNVTLVSRKKEIQKEVIPKEVRKKLPEQSTEEVNKAEVPMPEIMEEEAMPPSEIEQNLADIEAMNREQEELLEMEMQERPMPEDIDGNIMPDILSERSW